MKVVCYFAAAEGAHKDCPIADYDRIWPVMESSVNRCGYDLIHLTSEVDRARCAETIRYDVDPATVMFSREVAWAKFLESLPAGETACLVEPDAYLLRPIPDLHHSQDMLLLRRPGKPLPCGFRLARRSALSFYRAIVDLYSTFSHEEKVFFGDGRAHHEMLGIEEAGRVPSVWRGVRIEIRNWLDYTSKLWKDAVAWNFKGWSKKTMLEMANGKFPEMR